MSTSPSNAVEILDASESRVESFHACLDAVAREHIYIEMIEAPPLEKLREFQNKQIAAGAPTFHAVDPAGRVVGWCDITAEANPRRSHRGSVGMGLLTEYRGQGIGSRLLAATLAKARAAGIEKVELQVYTTNLPAIALYRKFGFVEEGVIRDYRRVDGRSFDCIAMAKFLRE